MKRTALILAVSALPFVSFTSSRLLAADAPTSPRPVTSAPVGSAPAHPHMDATAQAHADQWASVTHAVAVLNPASGSSCKGVIRFSQEPDGVKMVADVQGLTPGQKHAMHIHLFGDISTPDASSAGSHYNPEGHMHALPDQAMRHAGDLGNLQADKDGKAHYELLLKNISVAGTKNPIIGRAVVVHAQPDDGQQPVGNAGGRIAVGVIGVASGKVVGAPAAAASEPASKSK